MLDRLRGHDVVLLLTGLPGLHGEAGSVAYRDDLKKFLDELVTHMTGAGCDTNHFALYPFDEPGGVGWNLINQLVAFGKVVRAANPNAMIYVDGGGEFPMFQAIAPYIDIWCPGIYMLPDKTPLMDLATVPEAQPIRIVPILLQTLWSAIKGFFRRLFGRGGH